MSITNRRQGVPTAARVQGASAPAHVAVESPTVEAEPVAATTSAEFVRVTEAPMTTIMAAPVTTIAKPARFRVHKHGGLKHDGMYFAPGEELPMSADEIKSYGITCVEPFEG